MNHLQRSRLRNAASYVAGTPLGTSVALVRGECPGVHKQKCRAYLDCLLLDRGLEIGGIWRPQRSTI